MTVAPLEPAAIMRRVRAALPLRTKRLTLRGFSPTDFDAAKEIRNAPGQRRWTYNRNQTEAELMAWTAGGAATFLRDGDSHAIAIERAGALVGDVMLRVTSLAARQVELGWMLSQSAQGSGYAAEAAAAVLQIARDFGAHRAIAHLDEENVASRKVAERIGMELEARLVDDDVNPATGEYGTSLILAIRL